MEQQRTKTSPQTHFQSLPLYHALSPSKGSAQQTQDHLQALNRV